MSDEQPVIELDYEEILHQLATCPMTYLPAILIRLNELVYERKVLNPGGASRFAAKVEAKLGKAAPDAPAVELAMDPVKVHFTIESLKAIVADFHWMARRYADGRMSYATSMFNDRTREAIALGVTLNPTADGTVWASDSMGPTYDGLTPEERANPMMVLVDGRPENLAERDARMKREGAADELERLAAAEGELREMFLTDPKLGMGLRAFSHFKLTVSLRERASTLRAGTGS